MSNGGHRQRSGYRQGDSYGYGSGYSGSEGYGYVSGAVGGESYNQGYTPTQAQGSSTYNHRYAYEMYAQPEPYDPGTPQIFGYDGYDEYPTYSTYRNDTAYLNPGNGSGHSGYSSYTNYSSYSNYGSGTESYADSSSYSHHPTHLESRQSYPTFRSDSYAAYGRHSDHATRSYSNYSSHRPYSSYPSSQQSQPHPQSQGRENRIQRRASPVYDDYALDTGSRAYSKVPSKHSRTPTPPRPEPYIPTPSFSLRARSRSPLKEKRTKPTEEYLTISSEPSHSLAEGLKATQDADMIAQTRKLIVLDLNGTLVLRGQHRRAAYEYVSPTRGAASSALPFQARTVYPRPYLSTFIEYILHDNTKKWLDAMVWSSAQPRNVDDMVGRSFAERREELRAVWARDTLGLTNEDYHKKSITLKNLEKPWAELPFTLPAPDTETSALSSHLSPTSLPVSTAPLATQEHISGTPTTSRASSPTPFPPSSQITTAPSSPPPEQTHGETQELATKRKEYHHSPLSTLLIDDSPLKASLQPWNHLCIKEYVAETRKADLDLLLEEEGERQVEGEGQQSVGEGGEAGSKKRTREGKKERHRVRDARLRREEKEKESGRSDIVVENGDVGAESSIVATTTSGAGDEHLAASTAPLTQDVQAGENMTEQLTVVTNTTHEDGVDSAAASSTKSKGDKEYDQTLLAVIGILDRIRYESNVASWMRAGGLMHVDGLDGVEDPGRSPATGHAKPTNEGPATPAREGRSIEIQSDTEKGKRKGKSVHTPPTRSRDASPLLLSADSKKRRRVGDVEVEVEVEKADPRFGVEMDTSADGAQNERKVEENLEAEREAQAMTGVPLESSPPTPDMFTKSATSAHQLSSQGTVDVPPGGDQPKQEAEPEKPKLWFEHPDILAYWAARGKKALGDLGIAVVVGVRR